ncbi:transposase [Candidatus Woesearchaeota archaeon]|nr:transposase [Candidatus Woesearchaeota archaeon]
MYRCVDLGFHAPALDCTSSLTIDIGKYSIDVCDGLKTFRVKTKELHELLKHNPGRVYLEPSGVYHRPITRFLLKNNIKVFYVNTLKFKQYRDQVRPDHKTDASDAQIMHSYIKSFPDQRRVKKVGHTLEPYLRRYKLLSDALTKYKNFLETSQIDQDQYNTEYLTDKIKELKKEKQSLEKQIEQKIPAKLRKKFGITLTATLLTLDPSRFPTSKHWTSYLGLKLRTYESGTITKNRKITKKGYAEVRRLLYLRVMTLLSTKTEPYHSYFHKIKKRTGIGLKAMTATMRKLAKHFWAETKKS